MVGYVGMILFSVWMLVDGIHAASKFTCIHPSHTPGNVVFDPSSSILGSQTPPRDVSIPESIQRKDGSVWKIERRLSSDYHPYAPSDAYLAVHSLGALKAVVRFESWSARTHHGNTLVEEANLLQQAFRNNPHVLQFYELIFWKNTVILVSEYVPSETSLYTLTRNPRNGRAYSAMPESFVKPLFRKIIHAVNELHVVARIAHGNIHPGNIMIEAWTNEPKLTGFEFASSLDAPSSSSNRNPFERKCGLEGFVAPECFHGSFSSGTTTLQAVDVYALGVTLLDAIYGDTRHVRKNSHGDMIGMDRFYSIPTDGVLSQDVLDVLRGMMDPDPRKRWKLRRVLGHPWFNEHAATPAGCSGIGVLASFDLCTFGFHA